MFWPLAGAVPVVGSTLGQLFQPLYHAMAWIMAGCFTLVPNYAVAITLLTLIVMALSAPLTIRSVRSGLAMQRLQPELRKLRQKHKGNPAQLSQATLELYRRKGVNPFGSFVPALLQIPVFIVLYGVIRGLTHTIDGGRAAAPLYLDPTSHLARALAAHPGQMRAFGINLVPSVLSVHGALFGALPFILLVVAAVGLQYLQARQMNKGVTTPAASSSPLLRWLPVIFGVVYLGLPAALMIYVVVSSACRLGIQAIAMRPKSPTSST
jgi:YidC/Oxa1 family membrane protein insertase